MYKSLIEGKKAVFFDLDGTIADTHAVWQMAFEKILKANGLDWLTYDRLEEESGGAYLTQLWDYALSQAAGFGKKLPIKISDAVTQTIRELGQVLNAFPLDVRPGFWQLVNELKIEKKLKLALISNTNREAVDLLLQKLGIRETFELTVTGDEVKKRKPNPDIYLLGAKKLNLKPKEILVFEDSTYGAQAATKAKMDTLIVGHPQSFEGYPKNIKLYIDDFSILVGKLDTTFDEDLKSTAKLRAELKQDEQKQALHTI